MPPRAFSLAITSASSGKPFQSFSATFWPSARTRNWPRPPGLVSAVTPSSFWILAARLAARGR